MFDRRELDQALNEAQLAGRKQVVERSAQLGGQTYRGAPLRWVEIDEPPAVYFPDAYNSKDPSGWIMAVLAAVALLAFILAIVSATEMDGLFVAIFGSVALVSMAGVWWIDRATAKEPPRVERFGLVLTPDALLLRMPDEEIVVPRQQVCRFEARQSTPPSVNPVRFCEFVEFKTESGVRRIDLQSYTMQQQRDCCNAWLHGTWPPLDLGYARAGDERARAP